MAATIVSIVVVVLAGILNWYSHATYEPGYGFSEYGAYSDMAGVGDPIYIVIAVVSCALWPLGQILRRSMTASSFPRMLVFTGIVMSIYWIAVPALVLGGGLEYTHTNPEELAMTSIGVLVVAAIASAVYVRFVTSP